MLSAPATSFGFPLDHFFSFLLPLSLPPFCSPSANHILGYWLPVALYLSSFKVPPPFPLSEPSPSPIFNPYGSIGLPPAGGHLPDPSVWRLLPLHLFLVAIQFSFFQQPLGFWGGAESIPFFHSTIPPLPGGYPPPPSSFVPFVSVSCFFFPASASLFCP